MVKIRHPLSSINKNIFSNRTAKYLDKKICVKSKKMFQQKGRRKINDGYEELIKRHEILRCLDTNVIGMVGYRTWMPRNESGKRKIFEFEKQLTYHRRLDVMHAKNKTEGKERREELIKRFSYIGRLYLLNSETGIPEKDLHKTLHRDLIEVDLITTKPTIEQLVPERVNFNDDENLLYEKEIQKFGETLQETDYWTPEKYWTKKSIKTIEDDLNFYRNCYGLQKREKYDKETITNHFNFNFSKSKTQYWVNEIKDLKSAKLQKNFNEFVDVHLMKKSSGKFHTNVQSSNFPQDTDDMKECKLTDKYRNRIEEGYSEESSSVCVPDINSENRRRLKLKFQAVLKDLENDQEFHSVYIEQNFQHLKESELKYRLKCNFFSDQKNITFDDRREIIEWLVSVALFNNLPSETVHHAVSLIDRTICHIVVSTKEEFYLVGITSLLLAIKFEDSRAPSLDGLNLRIRPDTIKKIPDMEKKIITLLKFKINVPKAMSFAEICCSMSNGTKKSRIFSQYLCELSLLDIENFCTILPSCVGVASYWLACLILGEKMWIEDLQKMNIANSDLENCIKCLYKNLLVLSDRSPNIIQKKYALMQFWFVSSISPPNTLDLSLS